MNKLEVFGITAAASFTGSWVALAGSDVPITARGVSAILAASVSAGIAAAWPAIRSRTSRSA